MIKEFRPDVAHVRNIYHHLSPSILWNCGLKVFRVYHLNDFKLLCPSYNLYRKERPVKLARVQLLHVVQSKCYPGWPRGSRSLPRPTSQMAEFLPQVCGPFSCPSQLCGIPSSYMDGMLRSSSTSTFSEAVIDRRAAIAKDAPLLYFGRLSPEKGVDDLLRAMKKVRTCILSSPERAAA